MAFVKVIRSFATSSAGNAFPGLNGFAIMGTTDERSRVSSISHRASSPGLTRGYGKGKPRSRYQASVTSSWAKMPFIASASAIMFAIVFRYGIGSSRFRSTNSTLIPCDCFAPHPCRSFKTMSLPETQAWSLPSNTTRRCRGTVKYTAPVAHPNPSVVLPTPIPTAPYAPYARLCESAPG